MNLQTAILELAPRYRPAARVPVMTAQSSPEEIARDHDGALIVWSGASDMTVYNDPAVNHAFRAWHDAHHIAGRFGFDLAGERATCNAQIGELLSHYPATPEHVLRLIRAEIIGQAEHFAAFGAFPTDQAAFIHHYQQTGEVTQCTV